jgi:hypothetical protein
MKWVKEGEYGYCIFYTRMKWNFETCEFVLRREEKRDNNGEDEPNRVHCTHMTYMGMLQRNLL